MRYAASIIITTMVLLGCQQDRSMEPIDVNDPVDQILDRFIQASGGREAIAQVTTRIVKGIWKDDRPYRGKAITSPFTVWAHKDGRWRYESEYEVYGVDSIGGWWLEKGYVRDDSAQIRSKSAFLFVPQSPLHIDRWFQDRKLGTATLINGRSAKSIKTDRDDTYYALWIDDSSGTVIRIGSYWTLSDYQRFDGIQFPMRIEQSRKGGSIVLDVESVIQNQVIPDALLRRPEVVKNKG